MTGSADTPPDASNEPPLPEPPVPEAQLVDLGHGLGPAGPGWYVLPTRLANGWAAPGTGEGIFWDAEAAPWEQYGMNIHVLEPGRPSARYHFEPDQETYLVLSGECLLLIEEQERRLTAGDLVHMPPGTRHILVGVEGPRCAVLMIGARSHRGGTYPRSEFAAGHAASAPETTRDGKVAYAGEPDERPARVDIGWVFGESDQSAV